jgi:PadR family transcriptional regulator PadR
MSISGAHPLNVDMFFTFVEDRPMPKGQYLGEFELYVLGALARLGADAYGMTVRREIEDRAGRPVAIGAVYATLDRLARKGLVSFSISDPLPVPGGRARKHAHLTAEGRRALDHSMRMLARMLPIEAAGGRR